MVSEDSNTEQAPAVGAQQEIAAAESDKTEVTEGSQEGVAGVDDIPESGKDRDGRSSAESPSAEEDGACESSVADSQEADASDDSQNIDDAAADDVGTGADDAGDAGETVENADNEVASGVDVADGAESAGDGEDSQETAGVADAKPAVTAAAALKKRALIKKAMIVLAAAILIVIAGCCVALAIDDNSRTQLVPEKTTLDGQVDVSNMTEDELRNLVVSRADEGLSTVVSLNIGGTVYPIDLREVGKLAPQDTVAQAYAPYNEFFIKRWGSRIVELATNEKGNYNIRTACELDHNALKTRVQEIASQANHDPEDAGYAFESDPRRLVATPPVDGVVVDVDATVAKIEKAAASNDPLPEKYQIEAVATITKPEVLESGQAILVDTSECRVRLYEAGEEVVSYACTPGQSGYATPKGDWYLEYKDSAPVWINPHSDWSASMPDTIAPGASNPLGLRALAVSCGGGIYIHGTTNTGGLGYPGSHGCIRLSNSNIVDLYDRVSEGIPIIIR